MRYIERDTIVKWEVEFAAIDPQELQSMEEKVMKIVSEKIGESIFWAPEQEVSLLRFDNWKGEYVRIEDGEEMVDETIGKTAGQANRLSFMRSSLI